MPGGETKSSVLGTITSWPISRTSTPTPQQSADAAPDVLQQTRGQDHTISHKQRLSSLRYPKDCPPLHPRWFYAVDNPKSKPLLSGAEKAESKPLPPPKKFVPFSVKDSQSIESAFQQLLQQETDQPATSAEGSPAREPAETIKVPVNEDYLYDVDVDKRELGPAYWLGPTYEVRRGTWFFQEGSTLKPCEENLAIQLEEGYLKVKPWQFQSQQSRSQAGASSTGDTGKTSSRSGSASTAPGGKADDDSSRPRSGSNESQSGTSPQNAVYRLFGAYMNSTVTYQDATTAWLNYDDFMSRIGSTVYQRLGGGPGTKLVRGYVEPNRAKESAKEPDAKSSGKQVHSAAGSREGSRSPPRHSDDGLDVFKRRPLSSSGSEALDAPTEQRVPRAQRATLHHQMSSMNVNTQDKEALEEEARKQEEQEMEDSREGEDEERDREIDHLVLVTHGIGQRLGLRLESLNFIHDVNLLRKTLKKVYAASVDLQALNSPFPDAKKNCRVQVLPVCWRHLLDFPRQGLRQNRKEHDLAERTPLEDEYPSLADITLEGVPAVRNLISDLAMDVLLYQSEYREHIMSIVRDECNRIYRLFKKRNPSFKGTVSLCGHSLGSAILFDLLCLQQRPSGDARTEKRKSQQDMAAAKARDFSLDFECKELFCLGSPIALFQMLKGKTIAGRSWLEQAQHSAVSEPTIDPSAPACDELYNIFHPSDPVSYRLEPLITPVMTTLKPQPLPSVKKSIWTTSGQSLSNIGSRVGSLWTNFTTGVASSLLNRSLGLQTDDGTASQHGKGSSESKSHVSDGESDEHLRTLIEPEIETLYDGFRKARRGQEGDVDGTEERAWKLKMEEAKVRALNSNGRVDYSIQEGAFDISLIASIASHLSYWSDEDVNHFMLSQMLSRRRKVRRNH